MVLLAGMGTMPAFFSGLTSVVQETFKIPSWGHQTNDQVCTEEKQQVCIHTDNVWSSSRRLKNRQTSLW